MKLQLKLALFMFAIGLGSSYAYASESTTGSIDRCLSRCMVAYNTCLKYNNRDTCLDRLDACQLACGEQLP
ncbi:hypothetical protein ACFOLJ_19950 [Rugamonas sp. CCM 8940]|uniref:hypothetical protein n=1 Tax=Rugamonas sp. CCM 8940 TaxID=2765359 RepID=UPI0018F6C340|nr:hypothetical protein [Rugamonas sp. CCM 8940]MBJ7313841.1 hypothetical protein [Rugamonas sp. CCM 8940]